MTSRSTAAGNTLLRVLIVLSVATPVAFFAAIPWLKNQDDNFVYLVGGIATIIVLGATMAWAVIKDRRSDEWNRMSARFATHWGFVAGGSLVALMLALPPFHSVVVSIASRFYQEGPVDQTLILMTFTAGFMTCIFAQMVCIAILGAVWRIWMSRAI